MASQRRRAPRGQPVDDLAVLDYIARIWEHNKHSPSTRAVGRAFGRRSSSGGHQFVQRLLDRGLLTSTITHPGWPADLRLTTAGETALRNWRAQRESTDQAAPPAPETGGAARMARGAA